VVADIGMPPEVMEAIPTRLHALDEDMIRRSLKPRARDAHKGDFGRALLFCGSRGMAGAAALAAKAALRCGVGLAELAVPESIYPVLASSLHEPIFTLLPETGEGTAAFGAFLLLKKALVRADALLMGCGLGRGVHLTRLIEKLLEAAECPVVLDADGINAIAGDINILKKAKAPVILTPHPGEMGRLLGISAGEVQESRLECARDFAVRFGVTLILKGANTIIASPDQTVFMNMTGNAGMAAGGSGDVLAGMVASFLAQGFLPQDAAFCATYLHGLAGDRCAGRLSQRAMLPSDLIEALPQAILSLEGK